MCDELVSIIVPVYNVEDYLDECVSSLRNQTYQNIEILLIDDGSPDGCPQICDGYAEVDSRIKVIHQQNRGVSDARNTGIENATGAYISFVDSDDYVAEDYIELLYRNLNGCPISECGTILFDETGMQKTKNAPPIVLSWEAYLTETGLNGFLSYAVVYSKLYERRLFDSVRFPVGRSNCEDESTTYRLIFQGGEVSRIYTPLYYYRQRGAGASRNKATAKRIMDSELFFREKIQFFMDENRQDLARFFTAKRALSFIGLYKRADDRENRSRCLKIVKDSYKKVWWRPNIPLKYKAYIAYFLLVYCSILGGTCDKNH